MRRHYPTSRNVPPAEPLWVELAFPALGVAGAVIALLDVAAILSSLLKLWLHRYNYHRSPTALGGLPPIARVNNLSGNYT